MLKREFIKWQDRKFYILVALVVILLLIITLVISQRRIREIETNKSRIGAVDSTESFIGRI